MGLPVLEAAHVGRLADEGAVDALLQRLLPAAQVVVARATFGARFRVWGRASAGVG